MWKFLVIVAKFLGLQSAAMVLAYFFILLFCVVTGLVLQRFLAQRYAAQQFGGMNDQREGDVVRRAKSHGLWIGPLAGLLVGIAVVVIITLVVSGAE